MDICDVLKFFVIFLDKSVAGPALYNSRMRRSKLESGDGGGYMAVLEAAYDRHGQGLCRYALMILADHEAAQDAVQQAFMKVMRRRDGVLAINSPGDYLRTAVRNECYKIIRKRKRWSREARLLDCEALLEIADENIVNADEREMIETAIRELPARQREVLYMKIYEDKTFRQIAEITGDSINTVASRYRYAIDKLKRELY